MATRWEKVHVFISSTFNDMHAERDYLVKRVFPELQEWCERRRLRLVDIDLRWGITEEDAAQNKNVVKVCLRHIDACRPFFLCFLGQRYGWVPAEQDISPDTFTEYPKLRPSLGGASVTALEILHAVLSPFHAEGSRDPGKRAWYYEKAEHSFFYFREPSYLGQVPADPPLLRAIYADAPRKPEEPSPLDLLKEQIRRDAHRPVRPYEAVWHAEAGYHTPELAVPLECPSALPENVRRWRDTWQRCAALDAPGGAIPEEARAAARAYNALLTAGRLAEFTTAGPEGKDCVPLGSAILEDLQKAIADHFPEHREALASDDLQRELDRHELFRLDQTEGFIERPGAFDDLDGYARDDDRRLLVLTGASGLGKSALLARWVERQRDGAGTPAGATCHARFIGASDGSSVTALLRSLLRELKERYGKLDEDVPDDPRQLRRVWPDLLQAAGRHGRTILVLDALDQLETGLGDLSWLPRALPDDVKLVVSFRRGEAEAEHFLRRYGAAGAVRVSEVPPFEDEADRRRLVDAYLGQYLKKLDEAAVAELVAFPGARNPLFLKVVLSELRVFGAFASLHAQIRHAFGDDPIAAFAGLLRRLETDPGYTPLEASAAVPLLFGLLAHARRGLTVGELADLLVRHYPWPADRAPPARHQQARDAVHLYLRQARSFLARREGRIDFFYESFRSAACQRYQGVAEAVEPARRPAAAWHRLLAGYFAAQPPGAARALSELPYHQTLGQMWAQLHTTLTDLHFLEAKCAQAGSGGPAGGPTGVYDLQDDYRLALEHFPAGDGKAAGPPDPLSDWRRQLTLVARFLEREAHLLVRDPAAVPSHLLNRLFLTEDEDGPAAPLLAGGRRALAGRWWLHLLNRPGVGVGGQALLRVLEHGAGVRALAWSPDGQLLASAGGDGRVLLWEPLSGKLRALLEGPEQAVTALAWSPDGTVLASAGDDAVVRLWEPATGERRGTLVGHTDKVVGLSWSADGRYLASLSSWDEQTARVWDPVSARCVAVLEDTVAPLAWAPGGSWLAARSRQEPDTVRVWDPGTGRCRAVLAGAQPPLAWSADGQTLACAGPAHGFWLWQGTTGEVRGVAEAHTDKVTALAWAPADARLASGSGDGALKVWDRTTGAVCLSLPGHWDDGPVLPRGNKGASRVNPNTGAWVNRLRPPDVESVAWSPAGGLLASAGQDETVRVWDTATGQAAGVLRELSSALLAWSADGTLLAVRGQGPDVHLWDAARRQVRAVLAGHTERVDSLEWRPDGAFLASGSFDGTVRVWDPEGVEGCEAHKGYENKVHGQALAPTGVVLASTSTERQVRLWNAVTGDLAGVLRSPNRSSAVLLTWSPDGTRLATADSNHALARVWDPAARDLRLTLVGNQMVQALAWSPDGSVLAGGGEDHRVYLWDAASGAVRAVLAGHTASVHALAWSPDGSVLASGGDDAVHLWSAAGSPRQRLPLGGKRRVRRLAWSPDGRLLAASEVKPVVMPGVGPAPGPVPIPAGLSATGVEESDMVVRVWEASSGACVAVLRGAIYPLAWSPAGRLLGTRGSGDTVVVWDPHTGLPRHVCRGHVSPRAETAARFAPRDDVENRLILAWSPDGAILASGGQDGAIRLWDAGNGLLLAAAYCSSPLRVLHFTAPDLLCAADNGRSTRNRPACYIFALRRPAPTAPDPPPAASEGEGPPADQPESARPAGGFSRALVSILDGAWGADNAGRRSTGENQAEGLCRGLLPILEEAWGSSDVLVKTVSDLAATYEAEGEHAQAEVVFHHLARLLERLRGPGHAHLGLCMGKLGQLCRQQQRYAEAESFFRRSLEILDREGDEARALSVLKSLAGLYLEDLGLHDQAEPLYRRAAEVRLRSPGPPDAEAAWLLSQWASACALQGKLAEAEPPWRQAVAILEKAEPHDPRALAYCLNSLGGVCAAQGKHEEAEELFRRALTVAGRIYEPDHPNMAALRQNLEQVRQGRTQQEGGADAPA